MRISSEYQVKKWGIGSKAKERCGRVRCEPIKGREMDTGSRCENVLPKLSSKARSSTGLSIWALWLIHLVWACLSARLDSSVWNFNQSLLGINKTAKKAAVIRTCLISVIQKSHVLKKAHLQLHSLNHTHSPCCCLDPLLSTVCSSVTQYNLEFSDI